MEKGLSYKGREVLLLFAILLLSGCLDKSKIETIETLSIKCKKPGFHDICSFDCDVSFKNTGDIDRNVFLVVDVHEDETIRKLKITQFYRKVYAVAGKVTKVNIKGYKVLKCDRNLTYSVWFSEKKPTQFKVPFGYRNNAEICQGYQGSHEKDRCYRKIAAYTLDESYCKATVATSVTKYCMRDLEKIRKKRETCDAKTGKDIDTCYDEYVRLVKEMTSR